nr:2135_t:CDS:2 [Entrophospora candida]CAG8513795.1 9408_t:CDS:2 [Entrophospora candida]
MKNISSSLTNNCHHLFCTRNSRNLIPKFDKNRGVFSLQSLIKKQSFTSSTNEEVPFAGWSMPVLYSNMGILASHLHTRADASLFDVSHMLQMRILGKDSVTFIEKLVVADLKELPLDTSTLSVFTNEQGGIIDDTVICKKHDHIYIVSNAGCAQKDLAHIRNELGKFQNQGGDASLEVINDHALLALQGPKSSNVLQNLTEANLNDFKFMTARTLKINGVDCHVTRSGYTGEDGFEIAVPSTEAVKLANTLLENSFVQLAGLGSRDSLRLEAGLCLYGHDLDDTTSPVEAEGGFLGANHILNHIKNGVTRRRVGLIVEGAPARGKVTSGGPSPSLKKNIAMGYVKSGFHKSNTELQVKVRNQLQKARIVKMPFITPNYYK